MPHVDDSAPRLSSAVQAGAGLVAIAVLAPVAAFLGVLALASDGDQIGLTAVVVVLALGAAVGIIAASGWGAGRLTTPATVAYLTMAALLSLVLPWLMLTGLGDG